MIERVDQFLSTAKWSSATKSPVAGDLSTRQYMRLSQDNRTAILMLCDSEDETTLPAFIKMANWLREHGVSSPEIFAADLSNGFALIEDFGDGKLTSLIRQSPDDQRAYYETVLDTLVAIRTSRPLSLPRPSAKELCEATKLADQWYPGADTHGLDTFRSGLETVLETILETHPTVSLRDFHADNIMWLPERSALRQPGLLDFQDAFLTHPAYDLMSLLTDARIDVGPELRTSLITSYAYRTGDNVDLLTTAFAALGAQRNLRILGIFAMAARKDGKNHHLSALPRVYGYLTECIRHPELAPFASTMALALPKPDNELIKSLAA